MVILLVDDDLQVQFLIWQLLRAEGFIVLTSGTGEVALGVCRNHPGAIDLLLTDMEMPGMSGLELYGIIVSERPGIKCILMSGNPRAEQQAEMLGLPFLRKPFDTTAILEKIRTAVGDGLGGAAVSPSA